MKDLSSLNGTYFDGVRIETRPAQRRRRGADRQVPAHVLRLPTRPGAAGERASGRAPPRRTRASGQAPLLGIGQVLARLQPEFPELTPSKLRFLEEQRLVSPARTPSGYRKFSTRRRRAHHGRAVDATRPLPPAQGHPRAPRGDRRRRDARRCPGSDERRIHSSPARAAYAATSWSPRPGPRATLLDDAVVGRRCCRRPSTTATRRSAVLRALVALRAVGIEPRHLRGVRAAAEREAALVERADRPVATRRSGRQGACRRAGSRARRAARDGALERRGRGTRSARLAR